MIECSFIESKKMITIEPLAISTDVSIDSVICCVCACLLLVTRSKIKRRTLEPYLPLIRFRWVCSIRHQQQSTNSKYTVKHSSNTYRERLLERVLEAVRYTITQVFGWAMRTIFRIGWSHSLVIVVAIAIGKRFFQFVGMFFFLCIHSCALWAFFTFCSVSFRFLFVALSRSFARLRWMCFCCVCVYTRI